VVSLITFYFTPPAVQTRGLLESPCWRIGGHDRGIIAGCDEDVEVVVIDSHGLFGTAAQSAKALNFTGPPFITRPGLKKDRIWNLVARLWDQCKLFYNFDRGGANVLPSLFPIASTMLSTL
jgi:hypothetical protein